MTLRLGQRPLTASDADADLFVGRVRELARISKALRLGFNVLVVGEHGGGRTSLLRRLQRDLGETQNTHYVDAKPWGHPRELAAAVQAALGDDPRGMGIPVEPDPRWMPFGYRTAKDPKPPPLDEMDVQALVSTVEEPATILLDGPQEQCARALFGRFRDVLWEAPVQWVVTGDVHRRQAYLKPPADAFFETVVELEPLDDTEARELLGRRLEHAGEDPDISRLRGVTEDLLRSLEDRTPRGVLSAARDVLMAEGDAHEAVRRRSSAQHRAAEIGRPAAMLFLELESIGPTHAGDERLQQRLGYTRPRLVQVLKQLEEAGLVTSRREGRRVLYAVADGGDQPRDRAT